MGFALLTVGALLSIPTVPVSHAVALDQPPNIIVILTDDAGPDLMDAVPVVTTELTAQGMSIDNAFIPTSICCPSRAALLSGYYAHTTNVYTNVESQYGGWAAFQAWEDRTVAVALDNAGYRTALIGKYINGWPKAVDDGIAGVPVGWDVFEAFNSDDGAAGGLYYNYALEGTEPIESHGSLVEDYSTDVISAKAADFISNTPTDVPFFLDFSPFAPHGPFTPAERDIGAWHLDPLNAAVTEANVTDKPLWVQAAVARSEANIANDIQLQHESIMSVDDAVANILSALGPDRVANTLFIFTSDNGLMNGEHHLEKKYVPYSGATQVPLIIRWDGHVTPNSTDTRVMTPQDLTETIADAAGVAMDTEGIGLFDGGRTSTVLEAIADDQHPAYCGYRTARYMFAQYSEGAGTELYDYLKDPYELVNRATRSTYAVRLERFRARAVSLCSPVPPGFVW